MKQQQGFTVGVSRREFIKISGMSSIAVLCTPCLAASGKDEEYAIFESNTLPVLKKCDVVVMGGGFAGVSAAVNFARAGKKVVLVERRIYLGREITSVYRPWFDKINSVTDLPQILQSCIDPGIEQQDSEKYQLRFDRVKRKLEDTLFENGIEIVYASNAMQVLAGVDESFGLVIGNKSGRQAILSKLVLDCTETASVVHLTGQKFDKKNPRTEYSRTLEFTNVETLVEKTLQVPSEIGIKGNRVQVQRGYIGADHCYVECPLIFDSPGSDPESITRLEAEAWEKSIEVAQYLHQNIPGFRDAYFTNSAFQLRGLYTPQMAKSDYSEQRKYLRDTISLLDEKIALGSFATEYNNLFCINEASRLGKKQTEYIMTPGGASEIAASVSEKILENWSLVACQKEVKTVQTATEESISPEGNTKEKYSPQPGKPYRRIEVKNEYIPLIDSVDILIVGGGTSGAPATYTAAREGKRTMVIDMNPGFGGTGTYGGVQSYWGPGNYHGLTAKHIEKVTAIDKSFSKSFPDNGYGLWNVQAKMAMWLQEIRTSGARIIWNSFVVGSIMNGNIVEGLVISTPQGVYAVKSKVVIDATGDGDAAVFGGASYVLGSEHNHLPLWYAIRRQPEPGPTQSIFQSTVDVSNIEDYTRSVHVGLRTGGDNLHDHQPYLAPRESRHVLGEVVTTLSDHLTFREWEDVISYHRSNTDMKGYHASDWFRIGLIPPNLTIEIPYRSLIPKNVENIIITGKAISTTHDAFPAIRMQHDLENLGGIAALAAIQALDEDVPVREIDIRKFQKKLVELGFLPSAMIEREIKPRNYSEEELREWISQFDPEISLKSFGNTEMSEIRYSRIPFVEVCMLTSELAIPVLEEQLEKSSGKMQLRIALALAMHGSESGARVIYKEIEKQLSSESLPVLKEHVQHSGGSERTPPDQGAAPICANLIYALGMTRSDLNIFALELVSEMFIADTINDFQSKEKGLFFYVDAVGYAAELIANKAVIPYLKKLHTNPLLNQRSLKSGIEENHVLERLSLMELILGRALARSGSAEGYEVLIDYLDDMRAILAEFAHCTLVKITDQDHGKDKVRWTKWLSSSKTRLKPVPLEERPFD